ncbi:chemotaxis protein CheW [bacterium]|nr:MAG: chemotaxis protein CheW [bacterium]
MGMKDIIMFEIDEERYGFPIDFVREVVEVPKIMPVPETPDFLLGIINLRGEILAVIDTKMRLGLSKTQVDDMSKLIIVESDEHKAGFLVRKLPSVIHIDEEKIVDENFSLSPKVDAKYIAGVVEEEFLVILRPEKLLSVNVD